MAELEVRDYFALSITHHAVVVSQVGVECKFPDRVFEALETPPEVLSVHKFPLKCP
jgi:hypothetical protein